MRLIDGDALIDVLTQRCCKNCDKRMGTKNGKWRVIYEIGEAPCRACDVDDLKMELDEAPTIDAVRVVRCKDCKFNYANQIPSGDECQLCVELPISKDFFCAYGEKDEEVEE